MILENPIFFIELAVIILVIVFQIVHSYRVFLSIRQFRSVFDHELTVQTGYVEKEQLKDTETMLDHVIIPEEEADLSGKHFVRVTYTQTNGTNPAILRMNKAINMYLANNFGAAVNFSIIKDLIEREIDTKDEEITQSIPTPLYLGLAATMVGIIFGLYAMPDVEGDNFADGINKLIDGVKWAMTASLSGLLCTTILSSFVYKKAKRIVQQKRNLQLSYLQAKLLPELLRAEDTGVSGLKASLDRFAREATLIVDHVSEAATRTGMNIDSQNELVARLERLNMTKVSRANLELFDRLESNREAFEKFSSYLSGMEAIASNLKDFAARTANVDLITRQIGKTMEQSQELARFLTTHLEKIESAGTSALRAVDLSDSYFRESIDTLRQRVNTGIGELLNFSDKKESDLREQFERIAEMLKEVTSRHITEFMSAYSGAVPQFKQLDNLSTLASRSESILTGNEKANNAILKKLEEIHAKLSETGKNFSGVKPEEYFRSMMDQIARSQSVPETRTGRLRRILENSLRLVAMGLVVLICAGIILYYFGVI